MNKEPERMAGEQVDELDRLIEEHLEEKQDFTERGAPAAAISFSDRFAWAKKVGVDIEAVDSRVDALCEKIPPRSENWAVPRFRKRVPGPT